MKGFRTFFGSANQFERCSEKNRTAEGMNDRIDYIMGNYDPSHIFLMIVTVTNRFYMCVEFPKLYVAEKRFTGKDGAMECLCPDGDLFTRVSRN